MVMRTLWNLYHSIPLDRQIPTHPMPTMSDGWLKCYPNLCTWLPRASTFKLFATGCYRHEDASRPIPVDSPRRADSNETPPDSSGHLPAKVSAFFMLLTSIPMRTLRGLYHWIPLGERIPTYPVPTMSDRWLKCYLNSFPWVPRASTFKLAATGYYRHAGTERPIPFDSPRRADSNETLLDSGGYLPAEVSAFFILLTSIAMRTLWTLYHSIPLDRRIPTHPVPTMSDS